MRFWTRKKIYDVDCRLEGKSRNTIHWRISVISEYNSGSTKARHRFDRLWDVNWLRNAPHRRMYLWVISLQNTGCLLIYLYQQMRIYILKH
jgi:hypothetical protein